jgi:hypothetical protein
MWVCISVRCYQYNMIGRVGLRLVYLFGVTIGKGDEPVDHLYYGLVALKIY